MRIGELSRRADLPVATVKWYIRIGLLPKGQPTARNQADYDESHLHRLQFVRAVLEVGGLSIEQAQSVVSALDDPERTVEEVAATAHAAVSGRAASQDVRQALPAVDHYLRSRKWVIEESSSARSELAAVLTALQLLAGTVGTTNAGPSVSDEAAIARLLDPYADALEPLAEAEIAGLPPSTRREELAERIILGTVLMDQAISALRRLAQESAFAAHRARQDEG